MKSSSRCMYQVITVACSAFPLLFVLNDLCQIVSVLLAKNAANLPVLIEVTGTAVIRTVCMISDTIDYFCLTHMTIGFIEIYDKINNISKNIGTHGTFDPVSCHILVEGDFLLIFTKDGDEID